MNKIECKSCGVEIPEGRLKALPGVKHCINCSTTGYKKPIVTQIGEGDHTCTELFVVDEDEYNDYYNKNFSKKLKRKDSFGD